MAASFQFDAPYDSGRRDAQDDQWIWWSYATLKRKRLWGMKKKWKMGASTHSIRVAFPKFSSLPFTTELANESNLGMMGELLSLLVFIHCMGTLNFGVSVMNGTPQLIVIQLGHDHPMIPNRGCWPHILKILTAWLLPTPCLSADSTPDVMPNAPYVSSPPNATTYIKAVNEIRSNIKKWVSMFVTWWYISSILHWQSFTQKHPYLCL